MAFRRAAKPFFRVDLVPPRRVGIDHGVFLQVDPPFSVGIE
jgi:hypothetical protein